MTDELLADRAWHLIADVLPGQEERAYRIVDILEDAGLLAWPTPRTTHTENVNDLIQRLTAADHAWAYQQRAGLIDLADPSYLRALAEQVAAFRPDYLPVPPDARKWLDMLLRAAAEHPRGSALREISDKLFYALAHMDEERDDAETDYRLLADHIIRLTNPPDEDAAEVHVVMEAVTRLQKFAVSRFCHCHTEDPCPRCAALGRYGDVEVPR